MFYEKIPCEKRPEYIDEIIKERESSGYILISAEGTGYYKPDGELDSEFWRVNMVMPKGNFVEFHSMYRIPGIDGWTHREKTLDEDELRSALAALDKQKEGAA